MGTMQRIQNDASTDANLQVSWQLRRRSRQSISYQTGTSTEHGFRLMIRRGRNKQVEPPPHNHPRVVSPLGGSQGDIELGI